ncbi:hypothetical protein [Marinomonas shanghaiensis]|uniref:hypothetical protein n=1 Tax=Marinomonas shanghaiensis TaxID=2202418 RepID=UPI003A91C752
MASSIVACNEDHRFLIVQSLQALKVKDASIVLKPKGHNTTFAIALAALEATLNKRLNWQKAMLESLLSAADSS